VAAFEAAMTQPRDHDEKVRVSRAGAAPLQPAAQNAAPPRAKPARKPRPGKSERQAIKTERAPSALYEDGPARPRKPRPAKSNGDGPAKFAKPAGEAARKTAKPWPPEGAKQLKRIKRKKD